MRRVALALLALLASVAGAQELRVPVIGENTPTGASDNPAARTLTELAEEMLSAGLAGTAADLHRRALTLPGLTETERERASLGLALALLERNRADEATLALASTPDSPRKSLRLALAALLRNDLTAAQAAVRGIQVSALPNDEKPWGHAAIGMVGSALNIEYAGAAAALRQASESAMSEAQRQRIELLAARAAIQAGRVDDAGVALLERRARETQGGDTGFAFARSWAAALARQGDTAGALAALQSARNRLPANQAEADLACGILLGPKSDEAAGFLRAAAGNTSALPSIRTKAILSLARLVVDSPADRVVQQANAAYAFLSDSRAGCPRTPEIADAVHLARSQIMLTAGNRELARAAAEDLLRETPGSPLAPEAIRILALVAWGENAYRLAASQLERLVPLVSASRRDAIRTSAADCLMLARDFAVAERAYAALQAETSDAATRDRAFHQAVLCALEGENGLDRAAQRIDEAAAAGKVSRNRLLMAAWNTADHARRVGKPDDFARILGRFSGLTQSCPVDFALRFEWLRALSALANGDRTSALRSAESIALTLGNLPDDASPELQSAAPELRAHASLLRARASNAAKPGAEIRELVELRARYGKVSAAAASFLAEGRLLAAEGRHSEAQRRFEQLANDYAAEPTLAEFAALGLLEAAEQAAILAPTEGDAKLVEAARLLAAFASRYPGHPLVFRSTLRQAEIYRSLGDFDSALRLVEELARLQPQHPLRGQAELARGDCLMGLAALRRAQGGGPDRGRISRAVAAYERVVESWSGDADTLAEARHKLALALIDRARGEPATDAVATRGEARLILAKEAADLLSGSRESLGVQGRAWVARSLLLLGERCEADGDRAEAAAAYRLLRDLNAGLPEGENRLPGKAVAESKLAELERSPSNPTKQ